MTLRVKTKREGERPCEEGRVVRKPGAAPTSRITSLPRRQKAAEAYCDHP
jgi:hypothetical protein